MRSGGIPSTRRKLANLVPSSATVAQLAGLLSDADTVIAGNLGTLAAGDVAVYSGTAWVNGRRAWGIGTTSTPAIVLANTTEAVSGAATQLSPAIQLTADTWNVGTGRRASNFRIQNNPLSSVNVVQLEILHSYDAGAYSSMLSLKVGQVSEFNGAVGCTYVRAGGAPYFAANQNYGGLSFDGIFSLTDRMLGSVHTNRTDGANNIVVTSCYAKGSAITNAATMRLHQFSVSLSSGVNTEVGSFRCNGDLFANQAVNGQALAIKTLTELTTIAAAAHTDTAIEIPAHAIVLGVSALVQVAIPDAATVNVGTAATADLFVSGLSTVLGSSSAGTKAGALYNATAAAVRITPNASPTADTGRVRVTIHYIEITPPTS
jgi:hypothetical protein